MNDDNVFLVNCENANFPFDAYDGEHTILFDDFYGQIPYETLLRYLDRYKVRLNVKGSYTYANWYKVFFTSNMDIMEWYPGKNIDALLRRITKTINFEDQMTFN